MTELSLGNLEVGCGLAQELLARANENNDSIYELRAHIGLGYDAMRLERWDEAELHLTAFLRIGEALGNVRYVAIARINLALLHVERGEWQLGQSFAAKGMLECAAIPDDLAFCGAAALYCRALSGLGNYYKSAQWVGFTQMLIERLQAQLETPEKVQFERAQIEARAQLGAEFEMLAEQGAGWTIEGVVTEIRREAKV